MNLWINLKLYIENDSLERKDLNMAERSNEQKNFFKNLHTDQYKWNDFFLIPLIVTIVMMLVGQTGVLLISNILMKPIINDNNVDFLTIFQQYSTLLGVWIIALLYCYFTKKKQTNN